jgi:hypothetical protein
MKSRLFRRGKLVGLVNDDFFDSTKKPRIWEKLKIPLMEA